MKRLLGVKIFGVLFTVLGCALLTVLLGEDDSMIGVLPPFAMLAPWYHREPVLFYWLRMWGFVMMAVLFLMTGVGLLLYRGWARRMAVACSAIWICVTVVEVTWLSITEPYFPLYMPVFIPWVGFFGAMLWYFLRPKVKAQFQASRKS